MKKQDVSVGTRKNAWLLSNRPAIRHADRFANTGCLLSSEGDDVVAAFAVYVRVNISLPACGHASAFNLHVRAWLIASRKKNPVPVLRWDRIENSCGATRLGTYLYPLNAY